MKKLYAGAFAAALCLTGSSLSVANHNGGLAIPAHRHVEGVKPMSDDIINQIIESIPSPLEITVLIKDKGIIYTKSSLNDHNNVSKYETNYKMALNLGIYSTDLGYANIYGKTQDAIQYLDAVQELAKKLSIEKYFDYTTLKNLAQSSNLDELIQTTTRNFEKINDHLREQKRESISILLLTGGWVEATYLTTLIYNRQSGSIPELREKIGEQKLVLERLLFVLELYESKPQFPELIKDLRTLQAVYDKIEIETIEGPQKVVVEGDRVTITDETVSQLNMTDAQVKEISALIAKIRNRIIE